MRSPAAQPTSRKLVCLILLLLAVVGSSSVYPGLDSPPPSFVATKTTTWSILPASPAADGGPVRKLVSGRSVPAGLVPARGAARNILESGRVYDKELHVHENGTVNLVDTISSTSLWELSTGPPLSASGKITYSKDSSEYIIYPGQNLEVHEFTEGIDRRKHLLTIEEYVARSPVVRGSTVTVGSKTSTVYTVDAESGEIIHKQSLPGNTCAVPADGEEPIILNQDDGRDHDYSNVITIVRTDYTLSSSELGRQVWNWTRSSLTAYHHSLYEMLPDTDDVLAPSRNQHRIIPVRPINMFDTPKLSFSYDLNKDTSSNEENVLNLHPNDAITVFDFSSLSEISDDINYLHEPVDAIVVHDDAHRKGTVRVPEYSYLENATDATTNSTYKYMFWITLLTMLVISIASIAFLLYRREPVKAEVQKIELKGKHDRVKKRRKKDGTFNGHDGFSSSDKERNSGDRITDDQMDDKHLYLLAQSDSSKGHYIGKLFVSKSEIGKGSNGTVVFDGLYDGRPVAVKRLLLAHHEIAMKEIQNLMASDQHTNIVRFYGVEKDDFFVYISLERCSCSLADLIQHCSNSLTGVSSNGSSGASVNSNLIKPLEKDVELWSAGFPSPALLRLMRDVVSGLAHLHELGIIHRDLKPQNVLISMEGNHIRAKLSDMGISKRLPNDISVLSRHATGCGTSGWQAPELLRNEPQTRAVDLFSLGCLLFYCLTKGQHPFGEKMERDVNIMNNRYDLFVVDYIPEAVHLISQLLNPEPQSRPKAAEVLHHPLFWSSEKRLSFLRDTSDRIDKLSEIDLVTALENIGPIILDGKWGDKLDSAVTTDMGRYRKYNFESARDLLRLIRNKSGHYRELPSDVQQLFGPLPEGLERYFSSRFPKLLIEVYKVVCLHCRKEAWCSKYFKSDFI